MNKTNKNPFKSVDYWMILSTMYLVTTVSLLLKVEWYVTGILGLISIIITSILIFNSLKGNNEVSLIEKKMKKAQKLMRKNGDASILYKAIDEELLPALRNYLPRKIYKYYKLNDNKDKNSQCINSLKEKTIWGSIASGFNDPFEGQYMYLTKEDFSEMGFPENAYQLWESTMNMIRTHITTICFTQNPNDMPMWAHYANEHQGFCVEYEIINTSNFYPVIYAENRLKAHGLFIELFYSFFNENIKKEEKITPLRQIMLLNAFKDSSWKSENEIRAIFLNTKQELNGNGKLYTFDEIGIKPTKIFIGTCCNEENRNNLIAIANSLGIEYELCIMGTDEKFSVIANN